MLYVVSGQCKYIDSNWHSPCLYQRDAWKDRQISDNYNIIYLKDNWSPAIYLQIGQCLRRVPNLEAMFLQNNSDI